MDSNIDQLLEWDSHHYWHAFTQMAEYRPLIFERAEGVWLIDINGRKLLDGVSSMWCNVHGHRHPAIDQAITNQLGRVAHVTSLGCSNPTSIQLVRRLVEISPAGLECVFFSSDGACAIEVALKMAFQYWRQLQPSQPQRTMFMALGEAYHGDTLGGVSVGGVSRFHAMFDPLLFDVVRGPCPDSYRLPQDVDEEDAASCYLDQYRLLFERFGDRLAACIVEPLVQGAAGMIMHPPGFLKGIRQLTRKYDVLLIADEVATGIGRTGRMWGCEWEDVQPDLLCTGKGLTGGYLPMAATLTTREIWNAFLGTYHESRSFFHGHTYGGNPLSAAAALATLDLFDQERTLENVNRQGAYLEKCLQPLAEHQHVGNIRRRGLMAAVELVAEKAKKSSYPWIERRGWQACEMAQSKGVWLRPLGNSIVVMPPLCVKEEHIDKIVQAVAAGVEAATK
jgi:adenosylmethionine---8-amino-7-oxononanoate aminotransferase